MKILVLILTATIAFAVHPSLWAEGVDLRDLIQETQRMDQASGSFRMVWWMPTEYWEESFRNLPDMTQQQKETFYKAVDSYIVLAVIDAKVTDFGSINATPREALLSQISVTVEPGKPMTPLSDTDLSSDARNLFAMMKPVLGNMLGQLGQGMEFFCFNGVDSAGTKLLNPKATGLLSASLGPSTYRWRLPLGSLLPPKYDSETSEKFPGNYVYSPFTGSKLVLEPANNAPDKKK